MRLLENIKTPGSDEVTTEMFKYGGFVLVRHMQKLIKWKQECIPKEWYEDNT